MRSYLHFILLDAARLEERIDEAKIINDYYLSLYKGRSEETLTAVAPYLFTVPKNPEFIEWFIKNSWGDSSGVLISSSVSFEECYKHFRKFLTVKTEENKQMYFRFYDPRVLKNFLPTCTKEQVIEFFGPVEIFIVEGNSKEEALIFQHVDGNLILNTISSNEVFESEVV